jgi:hypothetical protein
VALKKQIYNFDKLLGVHAHLRAVWENNFYSFYPFTRPNQLKNHCLGYTGNSEIANLIKSPFKTQHNSPELLLTENAYELNISIKKLQHDVAKALKDEKFNLYSFVDTYV